jgi:KAP family P-loop domain
MYAYILRAHSLVSIMVDATSGADLEKTEDPNKHVLDYLRYYCELDNSFDFAVLLKGPWGAGKTYLINKFLTERAGEPSARHLYVSLYGITSFRQIEDAFFRQLHPFLSSKGMKVAATLARGALKTAFQFDVDGEAVTVNSQLPELDLFEYFKKPKECLLIFDDLERCSMRISDVLVPTFADA